MNIYDYQRLVGKIEDDEDLRKRFIEIFDCKDKKQMAVFAVKYISHILEITGFKPDKDITLAVEAVKEWIEGKTNYHKARNIAFTELYSAVRETGDPVLKRYLRTICQLVCVPHVKAHGLWGSDMAITLINAMYPGNIDKVREERKIQISILENC